MAAQRWPTGSRQRPTMVPSRGSSTSRFLCPSRARWCSPTSRRGLLDPPALAPSTAAACTTRVGNQSGCASLEPLLGVRPVCISTTRPPLVAAYAQRPSWTPPATQRPSSASATDVTSSWRADDVASPSSSSQASARLMASTGFGVALLLRVMPASEGVVAQAERSWPCRWSTSAGHVVPGEAVALQLMTPTSCSASPSMSSHAGADLKLTRLSCPSCAAKRPKRLMEMRVLSPSAPPHARLCSCR
mmetsp:Transcript_24330/g.61717  ORF Transcript_24330/g.61717 Transcript_24330/m.61717 type:complete len:246 (+) Transcript_24330:290-1027(+)